MPVRVGRIPVAAGLVIAALLLPLDGAIAEPQPTIAQARAKLEKLNDQAGKVVDRYNLANERWKKAKKNYEELNEVYNRQRKTVDGLRRDLVTMAVSTYQYGGSSLGEGFVANGDPQSLLRGMAASNQISAGHAQALRSFDAATRALKLQHGKAKDALADADRARDTLAPERDKARRLVAEQTKLLRRLGTFRAGDPNSPGVVYTGSASGNARLALQFAYAQIGKPYQWGGEGPGSYDCSGLTQSSWAKAGVGLPRTTYEQWSWGAGRRVPLDLNQLQPGDLLFSKGLGHMGMYAGNGKMVHAPRTGDIIKVVDLDDYWWGRLLGAIRP
ncbi:NlpC/P60 family protein [Streptosporangium lutulentum]|uniref:Cell wall-associated NlpC family hydrolase n=1 Tax=Streptosporangium lutulentum TaxID=1461250 RepID=A0ABT9Q8M0_9ACTN|nr:C40 family peptidase [Streptosporangium lutulentum]MDP9843074.1 cell wall-associated NlpC family hydrolase [Streptosporangium lutulentum]